MCYPELGSPPISDYLELAIAMKKYGLYSTVGVRDGGEDSALLDFCTPAR